MRAGFSRGLVGFDPRVKPPFGSVELDRAHPLAQGLAGCWLFNEQAGVPLDLFGRASGTAGGLTWDGLGLTFVSASSQYIPCGTALPPAVNNAALILRIRPTAVGAGAYHMVMSRATGTGNTDWEVQIPPAATIGLSFNGGDYIQSASTLTAGQTYDVGITMGSAVPNRFLYVNGRLDQTAAQLAWPTANGIVEFGRRTASSFYYDGRIEHAYWYTRSWPASEMQQLAFEPYTVFRPLLRRRYFVPATGGPTFQPAWAARSNVLLQAGRPG